MPLGCIYCSLILGIIVAYYTLLVFILRLLLLHLLLLLLGGCTMIVSFCFLFVSHCNIKFINGMKVSISNISKISMNIQWTALQVYPAVVFIWKNCIGSLLSNVSTVLSWRPSMSYALYKAKNVIEWNFLKILGFETDAKDEFGIKDLVWNWKN